MYAESAIADLKQRAKQLRRGIALLALATIGNCFMADKKENPLGSFQFIVDAQGVARKLDHFLGSVSP